MVARTSMQRLYGLAVAALFTLLAVGPSRADEFVLRSGGTISGELLNPAEEPRETYVVATATGGKIVLGKDQVVEVRRKSEAELLYEKWLPGCPRPPRATGKWRNGAGRTSWTARGSTTWSRC